MRYTRYRIAKFSYLGHRRAKRRVSRGTGSASDQQDTTLRRHVTTSGLVVSHRKHRRIGDERGRSEDRPAERERSTQSRRIIGSRGASDASLCGSPGVEQTAMNADLNSVIVNALTTGCTYGLIGIGFVLIFRATGVVSFAQSGFMVIGALAFGSMINKGWGLPTAITLTLIFLFAAGAVIYRGIFARLAGGEVFVTSVATIGLGTLIYAISLIQWGPATITIPQEFGYGTHSILGLQISSVSLFTIILTAATFLVVLLGLHRTKLGLRMRSVASDTRLAAYLGVNVVRMSTLAWAVAATTGGLAGLVYLIAGGSNPGTVYSLGMVAFPAILLGGFDSVAGALVGGILIAALQSVISVYFNTTYQDVAAYVILLGVLLLRPQGLFGSRAVVRI
jgi:branched-chain amino acid transport system permease protein